MQYKKPVNEFWSNPQKLTLAIATPMLFACRSLSLSLTVAAAFVALPIGHQQVAAALLTNWQFDPSTNQLEVLLPEGITPTVSLLNQPTQIVVDLPNIEVGTDTTQLYLEGAVRSVTLSQFQPGKARIIIDFAPGIALTKEQVQLQHIGLENRWVLRPMLSGTEALNRDSLANSPMPSVPIAIQSRNAPSRPPQTSTAPVAIRPENRPMPLQNPKTQIQPLNVPIVSLPVGQTGRDTITNSNYTPPRSIPIPVVPSYVTPSRPLNWNENLPATSNIPVPSSNYGSVPPPPSAFPTAIAPNNFLPNNVLLPAGSRLSLLYPGYETIALDPKISRQEVLLLQGGIVDANGNMIVPPNTPVIGRFETNSEGSRFVVQAIYLNGVSIPIEAKSDRLSGERKASQRSFLRNSGIGGLALFVLTGFTGIGLLAGAAVGAAGTYATAPQPATIQPAQIVQVRLTEDLKY
jgi:AMIN domain